MRSLRTLLTLGLVLTVAAPAAAGTGAWLAVAAWQSHQEHARRDAALALLRTTARSTPETVKRLGELGVEAQLTPIPKFAGVDALMKIKAVAAPAFTTPRIAAILQTADGKRTLQDDFITTNVSLPGADGTLFVRRESTATRAAITAGAVAAALAAALALAVVLLRRWVLNPLARMAADADGIAGGELSIEPVISRAREVAQVGDALHGMAGALQHALEQSREAETERRFLVSAIAHDLRTPLFTLRGSLEALEHGIGDGDHMARAQRKAEHLDRVVGDLFAFARADYAPTRERVELAELARAAAEAVDGGGKTIVVAGGPAFAHGDPVALQRALTNLIENAARHARTHVHVSVEPGRVMIIDDGDGFAAADLPHVFEPLFRGDRARAAGGAGLGLAIARRLARAHHGEVEASNAPGGGALVSLLLP